MMKRTTVAFCLASVLGTSLFTTVCAFAGSDYLRLVRHRDANGNLVIASPKIAPLVKKTVIPSLPKGYTFRKTQWGMSVPEVKESETAKLSWELRAPVLTLKEDRLGFRTTVEGLEAFIGYTFVDNRLQEAKYLFEPRGEEKASLSKTLTT